MRKTIWTIWTLSVLLAGSAYGQDWSKKDVQPGTSAWYEFSTDTTSTGLKAMCGTVLVSWDRDTGGAGADATALLYACPAVDSNLTSCKLLATLQEDLVAEAFHLGQFGKEEKTTYLRVDPTALPASNTALVAVGCAKEFAKGLGGGGGGGGGSGSAVALLDCQAGVVPPRAHCYDITEDKWYANSTNLAVSDGTGLSGPFAEIPDLAAVSEGSGSPAGVIDCQFAQCFYVDTGTQTLWVTSTTGTAGWASTATQFEIATGVTCSVATAGTGFTTIRECVIAPARASTSDDPDLAPLLQAAFDYCMSNETNDFDANGATATYRCSIRLASGSYTLTETVYLDQDLIQKGVITIDFGGSVVKETYPDPLGTVAVADLSTTVATDCDAEDDRGKFYVVDDANTPEDLTTGGWADLTISAIQSDAGADSACGVEESATPIHITTSTSHGLTDGITTDGSTAVTVRHPGDLLVVTGTTNYNGTYHVSKILDADEFCVSNPSNVAAADESAGTLAKINTVAWCNGEGWQAGRPSIYLGGPASAQWVRGITLKNLHLTRNANPTNGTNLRSTFIRLDSNVNSSGKGGFNGGIRLENISFGGNGLDWAQVGLDVGGPATGGGVVGQGVVVDGIESDAFGATSWTHTLVIRDVTDVDVRGYSSGHGGGIVIGHDVPGETLPKQVKISGFIDGAKDGPGLAIYSGDAIDISGMSLSSDVGTSNIGRIAFFCGLQSDRCSITAHGLRISGATGSEVDALIEVGDLDAFSMYGGIINQEDATDGDGTMFRTNSNSDLGIVDMRNVINTVTGGAPLLWDTSSVNSIDYLAPNCQGGDTVFRFFIDETNAGGADGGDCLYSNYNNNLTPAVCSAAASTANVMDRTAVAFSGPLWVHSLALSFFPDATWDNDDAYGFLVNKLTGAANTLASFGSEVTWTIKAGDTANPHTVLPYNARSGTETAGSLLLEIETETDPGGDNLLTGSVSVNACQLVR